MSDFEPHESEPFDPLEGLTRYQPHPLAHWCEEAAEMREQADGEWVWAEEALGLVPAAVLLKRYWAETYLDKGEKEFSMTQAPQGEWMRIDDLRKLLLKAEALEQSDDLPSWDQVRTAINDLLAIVEHTSHAWHGQTDTHPNTATEQARALLARLPAQE